MKRSERIRPAPLAPILFGIAGLLLLATANLTAAFVDRGAWPAAAIEVTANGTIQADSQDGACGVPGMSVTLRIDRRSALPIVRFASGATVNQDIVVPAR